MPMLDSIESVARRAGLNGHPACLALELVYYL
jgi:hypothetical protein